MCGIGLRKAFNVLNHDILLEKLKLYKCSRKTRLWFKSYLKDRTQYVELGQCKSSVLSVHDGVPQGSILGPLLFSLYINDVPLFLKNVDVDLYADDTTLSVSGKDVYDVQSTLSYNLLLFQSWCAPNKLIINTKKCKAMLICTRQRRVAMEYPTLHLQIGGNSFECVKSHKILGLIIDNKLSWREHIFDLCANLSCLVGLLWRVRNYLSYEMKCMFYNSFILSKIDYCLNIWGSSSKCYMECILKLQKRAARIILSANIETRSETMFNKLGWMTVYQRAFYQNCILTYKVINGMSPSYFNNIFNWKSYSHLYSLRSVSQNSVLDVELPTVYRDIFKCSFSFSGAEAWNKIPISVRQLTTLNAFKDKCKHFIIKEPESIGMS